MSFDSGVLGVVEAGGYISLFKIIPVLVILLLWAKLLTWVDKDAPAAHLSREGVNLGLMGGLVLAVALFLFLPAYIISLCAFIFLFLVDIGVYLLMRSSKVGLGDLKSQLRGWWKQGMGKKKEVEAPPGQVTVLTKTGPLPVPKNEDPDRPGYDGVQAILTDPLLRGAERIDLTPTQAASQIKYYVDGVPYTGADLDRSLAAAAILYLKVVANLKLEERRKPQTGTLRVMLENKRQELEITTAGNAAGEFLRIAVEPKKRHTLKLPDLGMLPEQLDAVQAAIADGQGVVLVTAPRGQGLTSMLYSLLRSHDAFLNLIHTIERAPDADLEGITLNKLAATATADEEFKSVDWVTSQEPGIVMLNSIENPRSAALLSKFVAGGHRRVYVALRAGNCAEAIAQWRKLVGDDSLAIANLRMVIAGRVLRKLCMACKQAFAPDPEMLRKLSIAGGKSAEWFQARKEPMRDAKGNPVLCTFCHELHYQGRTGIFEVLNVDDDVRQVLGAATPPAGGLRAAFRKQKQKSLQEAGLARVEAGDTSIQEMLRVLQSAEAQPAKAAAKGTARPAAK